MPPYQKFPTENISNFVTPFRLWKPFQRLQDHRTELQKSHLIPCTLIRFRSWLTTPMDSWEGQNVTLWLKVIAQFSNRLPDLVPRVFVPFDQRSRNERHCKDPIRKSGNIRLPMLRVQRHVVFLFDLRWFVWYAETIQNPKLNGSLQSTSLVFSSVRSNKRRLGVRHCRLPFAHRNCRSFNVKNTTTPILPCPRRPTVERVA